MRKTLLSLFFFPLIVSSHSSVETIIETEASGENASVHTEIINVVNGEETRVESDQPGEIKVEVRDGEVKVESSSDVQPTVVVSEPVQEEVMSRVEKIQERVFSFWEDLVSRLKEALFFFTLDSQN